MILRATLAAAAGLVALVGAACGDDGPEGVDVATSERVALVGTEMAFDPDEVAVLAGDIEVELRNEGTVLHDFRLEGGIPFILEALPGESDAGTVTLEPGVYEFYCSIAGHREAGMEGVLEVREPE